MPLRAASDDVWREVDELRHKLRMIISHASGGALSEPGDIDRSVNDICVEISRHKNEIWKHAQEVALRDAQPQPEKD
jgi:UDP-N-acetylglucosamine transferase subunit ALG13